LDVHVHLQDVPHACPDQRIGRPADQRQANIIYHIIGIMYIQQVSLVHTTPAKMIDIRPGTYIHSCSIQIFEYKEYINISINGLR
jgi:hypothetical protein